MRTYASVEVIGKPVGWRDLSGEHRKLYALYALAEQAGDPCGSRWEDVCSFIRQTGISGNQMVRLHNLARSETSR